MKYLLILPIILFGCSNGIKAQRPMPYEFHVERIKADTELTVDDSLAIEFIQEEPDAFSGELNKEVWYSQTKNRSKHQLLFRNDMSGGFFADTLLLYTSDRDRRRLVVWEVEDEIWSYLHFAIFNGQKLISSFSLTLGVVCEDCDSFAYSLVNLSITGRDSLILIEFDGQTKLRESSIGFGGKYLPNDIIQNLVISCSSDGVPNILN